MNITTGTGKYIRRNHAFQGFIACWFFVFFFLCISCKSVPDKGEDESRSVAQVQITSVSNQALTDYIELNATTSFIKKAILKSTANGYIIAIRAGLGEAVSEGQVLFSIKTKEAMAIGNMLHDSALNFNGIINIRSPRKGILASLNHQNGDYVQDGEQMAIISETGSLAFLLDVPFEFREYISQGKSCEIVLPDKEILKGTIASSLPSMDISSQTENYIVKASTELKLPENLIVHVRIVKTLKDNAQTLPTEAILTNEAQTSFWIMKLINDSTAVKVPVLKGIDGKDRIEILKPVFTKSDRILVSGNYGLGDTASVKVIKAR